MTHPATPNTTATHRRSKLTAGGLAVVLATVGALLGAQVHQASPAAAAASITVANDAGSGATADTRYRTHLSIPGRGFQVVRGGFGGVALAFGWVSDPGGGSWKPSRGGVTGDDYRYIPDSESADNQGYLKFIAYPGSSTESEAHAVLAADGSFSVDLVVPGPVFEAVDRAGRAVSVDCREVTCGVITIGAHGVKNPANETFTPVSFGTVYDAAPADDGDGAGEEQAGTTDDGGAAGDRQKSSKKRTGKAAVVADRRTARAGRAMAFTGQGFTPGEQVLAILDDGVISLGPMIAGSSGEVAGVMELPADLEGGTHQLRLLGAASGAEPTLRFPVLAADQPAAEPAPVAAADDDGAVAWGRLFLLVAVVVFVVALVSLLVQVLRRRRTRRRAPVAIGATS